MSCMLKFLHVSGRPVRKSGKNEKGTRRNHGGVFRVPGRLENIRELCDSPRARGSSRAKNSSFFGNFRRFWVGIRNTEKVLFVHAKKQPPRQIRQAAGGCCVHCFVRSTGIGISRARSAQVRPRQKAFPPRARGPTAVRRPPTHPRAGDDAFRRRRRVFFFFSCHVECVNNERVCISPEARGRRRRARPVGARAEGARVPRDASSSSPRA